MYSESGSVSSVNVDHGKPTNSWARPQFDDIAPKNITAIVGQTAELNCYVKRPGDRVDMWVEGFRPHKGYLLIARYESLEHMGRSEYRLEQDRAVEQGVASTWLQASFQPGFGQMNRSSILDEVTARDMGLFDSLSYLLQHVYVCTYLTYRHYRSETENRSYTSTTPVSGNDQSPLRSVPRT
ncbi:basement membrane-specific heparan sulfate proteoglycan core protein-like isoform X1, partial [Vespula squamosa]